MSKNPILDIQGQNQNPMMDVVNQIKCSNNPNAILQKLASTNPNVAKAMNLIQQNGGSAQQAFYAEAKRMGINPNQILSMLK